MSADANKKHKSNLTRSKWFTWTRDIVIGVLVVAGVMTWQSRDMLNTDGSITIEQQSLVSLQGEVLPLLVNDRPNIVYFFAPWCQICALSIGNLTYLDANKVNVVVVALDYNTKDEVLDFVERHDVKSKVLLGHDNLKIQFAVQGYPSYYLINKNQQVVSSSYGYSTAVGLKLREAFGA